MHHYRAYIMSPDDHIIRAVDLHGANDKEAMERARQLIDGHDIELWSGDRFVGKLTKEQE